MTSSTVPDSDTQSVSGKREKILNTALHLFTTLGFHATPTSQISREAGVSTGTLFHYFPDKNSLIDELYLSIKREMADVIRNEEDTSLPVRHKLENGFRRYIQWGMTYPEKTRFLMQFHHSPNISDAVQSLAFEEFRWLTELYAQAIDDGVLSNNPIHFHMVMTMQILHGILEILTSGNDDLPVEEIISAGLEKMWK